MMMTTENQKQISGLVDALYAEFTEKMAPAMPPEHKYSAAMMKRGLEILAAYVAADNCTDNNTGGFSAARHDPYSDLELARALRQRDPGLPAADELHRLLADDVQSRRRQANPKAVLPSAQTL